MRFLLVFLWLLCASLAVAGEPEPLFRHYGSAYGLPTPETYCVIQDSKGYIWTGTDLGVSRFDGYRFTSLTLPDSLGVRQVFRLYEDYRGWIWFLPANGELCYYNPADQQVHVFPHNRAWLNHVGLKLVRFSFFEVKPGGDLFFGVYDHGAYTVSGKGEVAFPDTSGAAITVNAARNPYTITTLNHWSQRIKLLRMQLPGFDTTLQITAPITHFNEAASAIPGGVLFLDGSLVVRADQAARSVTVKQLPYQFISLLCDRRGNTWVGAFHGGVQCYSKGNWNIPAHYLKGLSVSGICEDREGGLWFSTLEKGLCYLPSVLVKTYRLNNDEQEVRCISPDGNGGMYAGLPGGRVYRIAGADITPVPMYMGNSSFFDLTVLYYDHRTAVLYAGDRYRSGNKLYLTHGQTTVKDIVPGKTGLWLGAHNGILHANSGIPKVVSPGTRVQTVCEDIRGKLWAGNSSGLWWLSGDTLKSFSHARLPSPLSISILRPFKNGLCIGTHTQGLFFLMPDTLLHITMQEGLASNTVKHIFIENNLVWVASNQGITRIDWSLYPRCHIRFITSCNGLPANEINQVYADKNHVWVATQQGLSVFDRSGPVLNQVAPLVHMVSLKVNERDTLLQETYTLNYRYNNLVLGFVGLSYRSDGHIFYRYRMSGLDSSWTYTHTPEARYNALPAGRFTFEVYAMNHDGIWSANPEVMRLTMLPPFWKTTWFTICCIGAGILMVLGIYRYQVRQIVAQNKIREEMNHYHYQALRAQMNPHFLFNSLNSVQNFILRNERQEANKYLTRFARLIRRVLDNSRDAYVSLSDEIEALQNYLELEAQRFEGRFTFHIALDPQLDPQRVFIPTLLFQPFVENAVWHGILHKPGNGSIFISIGRQDSHMLRCIVRDDGIGRAQAARKTAPLPGRKISGMQITARRLELIHTLKKQEMYYRVNDLTDGLGASSGTEIIFTIPYLIDAHERNQAENSHH